MTMASHQRYAAPGFLTRRVFNPVVAWLARRLGVGPRGLRVLSVRGRNSGEWRDTPVNLLTFAGRRYLVAPRGQTQWVRNLRVSREARLTLGRVTETVEVEEVADPDKPPILRAYLAAWAREVQRFFPGLDPEARDEAFVPVAARYPVFRIVP
jgi:F420H(2)-dependent quinone reductase